MRSKRVGKGKGYRDWLVISIFGESIDVVVVEGTVGRKVLERVRERERARLAIS